MFDQLYILPILLFSVVIHEIAHGYMALRLGDPTARDLGRLTLNPIPHIDLIGSIIVPLFSLIAAGSVFIAWAKPIPINPNNFSNLRRDDVLVSVVGPLSNIILAMVCSVVVVLLSLSGTAVVALDSPLAADGLEFLLKMFYGGVYLNIVLAVFNLIPIPPLDGSHMFAAILPASVAEQYRKVGFLGILIVIGLMRIPAFSSAFSTVIGGILLPFRSFIALFL
ncbi:MAG: site-2 protease family protein [Bacteroidota bacterium]